jgi:hypothetical protein
MAFRRASKTKKWQIKAKLKSHHFRGKINWFKPQKKKLKVCLLMILELMIQAADG